jgi:hypothetical protein
MARTSNAGAICSLQGEACLQLGGNLERKQPRAASLVSKLRVQNLTLQRGVVPFLPLSPLCYT